MERDKRPGACCETRGSKGLTWDRYTHDGRPRFYCSGCGDEWTSGHDGQPYMKYASSRTPHRGQQQWLADAKQPADNDDIARSVHTNRTWKKRDKRPHITHQWG